STNIPSMTIKPSEPGNILAFKKHHTNGRATKRRDQYSKQDSTLVLQFIMIIISNLLNGMMSTDNKTAYNKTENRLYISDIFGIIFSVTTHFESSHILSRILYVTLQVLSRYLHCFPSFVTEAREKIPQ
ncbi:hypothetical protein L9F63_002504, partial [Diploptera punctata]